LRIATEVFAYAATICKIFPTFLDTAVLSSTSQLMPRVFLPGKCAS